MNANQFVYWLTGYLAPHLEKDQGLTSEQVAVIVTIAKGVIEGETPKATSPRPAFPFPVGVATNSTLKEEST